MCCAAGTLHAQAYARSGVVDGPLVAPRWASEIARLKASNAIDRYLEDVVREVSSRILGASRLAGRALVVNDEYQPGAVHVYAVDPDKLTQSGMTTPFDRQFLDRLEGGATTRIEDTALFLSAPWLKRLMAATRLTQSKRVPELSRALALVDVYGLDASREYWATPDADSDEAAMARLLVRGALAFVLAHELSHVLIGPRRSSDTAPPPDSRLTSQREIDERAACPDLNTRDAAQQQRYESQADALAVELIGRQCLLGEDGKRQHAIFDLGMQWHFLAAMWTTVFKLGRATSSPYIASTLKRELGEGLYGSLIARHERSDNKAVHAVFIDTHPPDMARIEQLISRLKRTPCGTEASVSPELRMFERERARVCTALARRSLAP
jgi:hypothetical protein